MIHTKISIKDKKTKKQGTGHSPEHQPLKTVNSNQQLYNPKEAEKADGSNNQQYPAQQTHIF